MTIVKKVIHMYKTQKDLKSEDYDYNTYMRMFRIYRSIVKLAKKDNTWLSDGKMLQVDVDELKQLFSTISHKYGYNST